MSLLEFAANPSGGGKVTVQSPPSTVDRTLTLPDATGNIIGYPAYRLWLTDSPGRGSTNTAVMRFTTTQVSVGTSVTYADSATNGASFTVVDAGLYQIEFAVASTTGAVNFALTVNASGSELTAANAASIAWPTRVALQQATGANLPFRISTAVYLNASDVVRAQITAGTAISNTVTEFRMTRIG